MEEVAYGANNGVPGESLESTSRKQIITCLQQLLRETSNFYYWSN